MRKPCPPAVGSGFFWSSRMLGNGFPTRGMCDVHGNWRSTKTVRFLPDFLASMGSLFFYETPVGKPPGAPPLWKWQSLHPCFAPPNIGPLGGGGSGLLTMFNGVCQGRHRRSKKKRKRTKKSPYGDNTAPPRSRGEEPFALNTDPAATRGRPHTRPCGRASTRPTPEFTPAILRIPVLSPQPCFSVNADCPIWKRDSRFMPCALGAKFGRPRSSTTHLEYCLWGRSRAHSRRFPAKTRDGCRCDAGLLVLLSLTDRPNHA